MRYLYNAVAFVLKNSLRNLVHGVCFQWIKILKPLTFRSITASEEKSVTFVKPSSFLAYYIFH